MDRTPGPTPTASNHDEMHEGETVKRKRQPRNSACQACSALKMKCIPGPEAGKCERCHRMKRECVPAVVKPRKRRTQSVNSRESPSKGMQISDILDNNSRTSPHVVPIHHQNEPPPQSLPTRTGMSYTGNQPFAVTFGQSLSLESSAEELLQGVDYATVQTSFTIFRQLAANFPFVSIRPDSDSVTMVLHRPMTTLAICCATSPANPELQERLAHTFRLALSAKALVAADRSLDLMVGLLIYIAFHHQYFAKQQIYQEICLLAGMATDLGLYNRRSTINDAASAVERDRAFLGCYYICCGVASSAFNKPSPMRWSDNLRRYAEELSCSSRLPTDRSLVAMIEVTHALQDLEEDLRADDNINQATLPAYIDLHVKAAHHRLKSLKRDHPSLAGTLGYAAATIHLYHLQLKATDTPDTSTLIQCSCAIKDYLEDILARPPITLHQVNIIEWTNLLEILILMARVSKPLPQTTGGWEAGAMASMLQPEIMLDTICARMGSVLPDPLSPTMEITFNKWFRQLCDGVKKRILQDRSGGSTIRNEDANFDYMSSLGARRTSDEVPAVSAPSSMDLQMPGLVAGSYDSMEMFGVLDESFWQSFML